MHRDELIEEKNINAFAFDSIPNNTGKAQLSNSNVFFKQIQSIYILYYDY